MTLNDRFEFISAFHSNMLRFPNRSCFFLYERLLERLNYVLWPLFFPLVTIYRLLNRHRQQLVAISGSVGKTTTTRAVYFFIHGFVPDWIHGGENSFCATGWNLLRQGYHSSRVVLEIGIGKAGQMQRYAKVFKPDLVIMTSITSDHLKNQPHPDKVPREPGTSLGRFWKNLWRGGFISPEELWREKGVLPGSLSANGLAILNRDDPQVMRMMALTKARVTTFGFHPESDYSASNLAITSSGTRFTLTAEGTRFEVLCPLIGREAIRSVLAAVAAARSMGIRMDVILNRLEALPPTPGRMQPFLLPGGPLVICDDFKGGFETFLAALDSYARMETPRKIVVLGDLYKPLKPKREKYVFIGKKVSEIADRVILVGWHAQLFRRGFTNLPSHIRVDNVSTFDQAATLLKSELKPEDVVLIKACGGQKLVRIALELSGKQVDCQLRYCKLDNILCPVCPTLNQKY